MAILLAFVTVMLLLASACSAVMALCLDAKDEETYKKNGVGRNYIKASFWYTRSAVYFVAFLACAALTLGVIT